MPETWTNHFEANIKLKEGCGRKLTSSWSDHRPQLCITDPKVFYHLPHWAFRRVESQPQGRDSTRVQQLTNCAGNLWSLKSTQMHLDSYKHVRGQRLHGRDDRDKRTWRNLRGVRGSGKWQNLSGRRCTLLQEENTNTYKAYMSYTVWTVGLSENIIEFCTCLVSSRILDLIYFLYLYFYLTGAPQHRRFCIFSICCEIHGTISVSQNVAL